MNILIVEADPKLRAFMRDTARPSVADCGVIAEAEDGRAALAICRTLNPKMAIVDIDLPDGDGLDLIPQLREIVPSLRALIVADRVDPEIVLRCEAIGIQGFVDKPTVLD